MNLGRGIIRTQENFRPCLGNPEGSPKHSLKERNLTRRVYETLGRLGNPIMRSALSKGGCRIQLEIIRGGGKMGNKPEGSKPGSRSLNTTTIMGEGKGKDGRGADRRRGGPMRHQATDKQKKGVTAHRDKARCRIRLIIGRGRELILEFQLSVRDQKTWGNESPGKTKVALKGGRRKEVIK